MSLDVSLFMPGMQHLRDSGPHIFVREDGQTKEISREEWDARFPGREPVMIEYEVDDTETVYSANITHNLNTMASNAGVYEALWRPEDIGATHAEQLILPLRLGMEMLRNTPDYFRQFNPTNSWGSYKVLLTFVENYLAACGVYPDAEISVSR